MKKKVVFNWSGGKDSALALKIMIESGDYEIVSLLTTVNSDTKESTLHKIPEHILKKQIESLGFDLYMLDMKPNCDMVGYENSMMEAVEHFKSKGVTAFAFGDIHLYEIKAYREEKLIPFGIEVIEPLWDMSSEQVMNTFIESGLKTMIVTVTKPELAGVVGSIIDKEFVANYPKELDLCGENGEYHTFCFEGSIFNKKIDFDLCEVREDSYEVKYDNGKKEMVKYWYAVLK